MNLWMDVSYNDEGEINSIVCGCHLCSARAIANEEHEASAWLQLHNRQWHEGQSMKIEQVGPPKKTKGEITRENILAMLVSEDEPVRTIEVSTQMNLAYNTAYVALRRLRDEGMIRQVLSNNVSYWEAA